MNQAKYNVQQRLRNEDRYSHKMQGVHMSNKIFQQRRELKESCLFEG